MPVVAWSDVEWKDIERAAKMDGETPRAFVHSAVEAQIEGALADANDPLWEHCVDTRISATKAVAIAAALRQVGYSDEDVLEMLGITADVLARWREESSR